jgi:hypothetical protein
VAKNAPVRAGAGRGESRLLIAGILFAAVPMIEITVLGANGALLAALAAILQTGSALVILALVWPAARLWKGVAPVLLVILAGLGWACLPEFASSFGWSASLPWGPAVRFVPDLLLANICRYLGTMATLVAGAMIGYRRGLMRTTVDWLIVFGTINAVTGLVLREIDPVHIWGLGKNIHRFRFTGTLQNANAAACIFGVITLLAVARLLVTMQASRGARGFGAMSVLLLNVVAVVIGFGACLITGSRATLMLAVLGLAWLGLTAYRDRAAAPRIRWLTPAAIAAACLAMLALFGELTLSRMDGLAGGSENRWLIWQHYWGLAVREPVYGYGLGSFSDMNLHFLSSREDALNFAYINAAHNHLLQLLLAGGWPFVASQIVAVALMVVPIARNRRVGQHDPVFSGLWLGLAVIGGCSMIDVALAVPAILTLAATLIGLLWGRSLRLEHEAVAAGS